MYSMHETIRHCLVIGGAGNVGKSIVKLCLRAKKRVRVLDIRPYQGEGEDRVESRLGDVRSAEVVAEALQGIDTVFHVASLIDVSQFPPSRLRDINVNGTRNVVQCCIAAAIPRLVYTSSIEVVIDGKPKSGGDALDGPAVRGYAFSGYQATKAEAETIVLRANGTPITTSDGKASVMHTVAVRPCHVYGENDPLITEGLVHMASRWTVLRPGHPSAKLDFVYVDNVAHCHCMAASALCEPAHVPAGKAYVASENFPMNTTEFLGIQGKHHGVVLPRYHIPSLVMYYAVWLLQVVRWFLHGLGLYQSSPFELTLAVVLNVAYDQYGSYQKAERDFGYRPLVPTEEAMRLTTEWSKTLHIGTGSPTRSPKETTNKKTT